MLPQSENTVMIEQIVGKVGWQKTAVYLDRDALTGKAGTTETCFVDDVGKQMTAELNPSWARVSRSPPQQQHAA